VIDMGDNGNVSHVFSFLSHFFLTFRRQSGLYCGIPAAHFIISGFKRYKYSTAFFLMQPLKRPKSCFSTQK